MAIFELRKGRFSSIGYDYFVTFNTKNRQPYLANPEFANIVAQTIHYHQSIALFAWVIMPDHVHLLFTLKTGNLSRAIQSIKSNSSRKIRANGVNFRWAQGFYDHGLRKEELRIDISRYIVANPLRAQLVDNLAEYPWWDSVFL